jgi:putative membrane protein
MPDFVSIHALPSEARILSITRPSPKLLHYYLVRSLFATVAFPLVAIPLYFKYHTLRYRFDAEGVSMSWGILFRREINLTYKRIQDIHLTRGILERWFGLATLQIQTASGAAGAEMNIQGIEEFEALRDFFYGKMRGRKLDAPTTGTPDEAAGVAPSDGEALELLRSIHTDLAALRRLQSPSRNLEVEPDTNPEENATPKRDDAPDKPGEYA